jgi:hypothetical protein
MQIARLTLADDTSGMAEKRQPIDDIIDAHASLRRKVKKRRQNASAKSAAD